MPTAHAANHIRNTHRKARLASKVQLRKPYGITVIDETGALLDPVKQILDIIAEHDAILSSGHLHIAEVWKLFDEAKARGVKRLIVNHPVCGLHCTYEDVAEQVRNATAGKASTLSSTAKPAPTPSPSSTCST